MRTFDWDSVIAQCITEDASDVLLLPDCTPLARIQGGFSYLPCRDPTQEDLSEFSRTLVKNHGTHYDVYARCSYSDIANTTDEWLRLAIFDNPPTTRILMMRMRFPDTRPPEVS